MPAVDTYDTNASPTALTMSYYADDMVHTMAQDGDTKTFTLDPTERLLGETDSGTSVTETNIYADSSDSPAWISTSTGGWSRNITDLAGNLAATETAADTGDTTLQLTNIHGDVVATAPDSSSDVGYGSYSEATEFGAPRASDTPAARYGWLGGKKRSSDALAGVTLMGERVYLPTLGRFLSCDPVPGGSANNYDYVDQDPISAFDLNGEMALLPPGGGTAPIHVLRPDPRPEASPVGYTQQPAPRARSGGQHGHHARHHRHASSSSGGGDDDSSCGGLTVGLHLVVSVGLECGHLQLGAGLTLGLNFGTITPKADPRGGSAGCDAQAGMGEGFTYSLKHGFEHAWRLGGAVEFGCGWRWTF